MRQAVTVAVCLMFAVIVAVAQERDKAAPTSEAAVLEAKVRQVWADFKNKNKDGLAAVLADDFRELEEDGAGFGDRKAEIAMVDGFDISTYTLKDFRVRMLGKDSALVNYAAHYEGKADGQPIQSNTAYGEVWVRQGNAWRLLYAQETNVK
jgi:hypothetical protein